MKKLISMFAVALLGGAAAFGILELATSDKPVTIIERIESPTPTSFSNLPPAAPMEGFTAAAEASVNAVVHVKTESTVTQQYNPWFDFFGYDSGDQVQRGSGSGVIISTDGYIVTNNHVIEGADNITVSMNDNRTLEATIVGTDPATDIALLKIEETGLPTVRFGDSDNVKVGEWVLAVGNPFDLTSTVTAGIVSAKARNINLLRPDVNREIFPIESFIQTDAAVNPGNSGGALVNTRGELVGINTAIASRTGSYSGYSFAVPSTIVSKVTADLKEFGMVQRAFIGVRISEVNQAIAEESGLKNIEGIYVSDIIEQGAAENAGMESGDIILEVEGVEVKTVPQLQEQISRYRPGDNVDLAVWRNESLRKVNVTLRNKDGNTELKEMAEVEATTALGASFSEISSDVKNNLGIHGGAEVTILGNGKLRESGVKKGFIITKVDGTKIYDTDDLIDTFKRKSGGVLVEGVYPNGQKAYYGFGL